MEQRSRVYINPNFNTGSLVRKDLAHSKVMHINPNFTQNITSKIFVNPNFIKPNSSPQPVSLTLPIVNNNLKATPDNKEDPSFIPPTISKSKYSLVRCRPNLVIPKPLLSEVKNSTTPIITCEITKSLGTLTTKSRFSIIRKPNNDNLKQKSPLNTKITTKINNRYKLVNTLIKNQDVKSMKSISDTVTIKNKIIRTSNVYKSQYKLLKCTSTLKTSTFKSRNKFNKNKNKSTTKIGYNMKLRRKTKKYNIPCPLFRKFGKCIRNIKGSCDFLHDKKHVSICRKFLKGICHDTKCLLSHDLTDKKMPTCSFYLKGMCTKESCPYLHVKISEKNKVCPEFLKGYCEKGSNCLNRHVYNYTSTTKFKTINRKKLPKKNNRGVEENKVPAENKSEITSKDNISIKTDEENILRNRYYRKASNLGDKNDFEIIKPVRCKLGNLPSFIQL